VLKAARRRQAAAERRVQAQVQAGRERRWCRQAQRGAWQAGGAQRGRCARSPFTLLLRY